MLFMGIDTGTQGVRALICDETGNVYAAQSTSFARLNDSETDGRYEQDPAVWWEALYASVLSCTNQLKGTRRSAKDIRAIAIDGTSGTILPVDKNGNPLTNAIMYNDMRAKEESKSINQAAAGHEAKLGMRFNPSFALPRILWLRRNRPDVYENAHKLIHQTDYLVGKLCGEFGVSDYSNALKTGYDLIDERWPDFIEDIGIDANKLPRVGTPGMQIGTVSAVVAEQLGLSTDTALVAGCTDSYASALAAGAVHVGDWASILGTTLVLKGVSGNIVIDPTGSSYSHKLPTGNWMVGGASNVGGRRLSEQFDAAEFESYNQKAENIAPSGVLIYPLTGKGERYPFFDPDAQEFVLGDTSNKSVLFTAVMEGVGYTERLAYELNLRMGIPVGEVIYTSGGACKSDAWLRIRASILNRTLKVPSTVDAAMGMALMAASKTYYDNIEQAATHMISFSKTVDPVREKVKRYDELYGEFHAACKARFTME